MSSEGRKKRGAAGVTNAKNSPWRMNGRPPDWMARSVGAFRSPPADSSGSVLMRGMVGGVIAQNLGLGNMVGEYERRLAHAQQRVTSPWLTIGEEPDVGTEDGLLAVG